MLSEGDPVQFEAVPQDSNDNPYYCSWFASLIWKGKRPPFEEPIGLNTANILSVTGRRGSIGSTGKSLSVFWFGGGGGKGPTPFLKNEKKL